MEPELEQFLKDNPDFELNDYGKVHCKVTNHDIVATMEEVNKHMKSDKFLHAKNWYNYDYSKYLPLIKEHTSDPKKLFCIVTKTSINKIPEVVERHVQSKRFKRLCEEYNKRQQEKQEREKRKEEKRARWEAKQKEGELDIDGMLGLDSDEEEEEDGCVYVEGGESEEGSEEEGSEEEGIEEGEEEEEESENDHHHHDAIEDANLLDSEEELPKRKNIKRQSPTNKRVSLL